MRPRSEGDITSRQRVSAEERRGLLIDIDRARREQANARAKIVFGIASAVCVLVIGGFLLAVVLEVVK